MADPFLVNPQSLSQMDSVPVRGYLDAMNWQNNAQSVDDFTLQDMPRARAAAQAKEQADLASVLSMNRSRDMGTETTHLGNVDKQRNNDVRATIPMSDEIRAKLAVMSKEISEAELADTIAQTEQKAMTARTPEDRAKWAQIRASVYEMRKMRQAQADVMERERYVQGQQNYRTDTTAAAGVEAANVRANASKNVLASLDLQIDKYAKEPHQAVKLINQRIAALDPNDPENGPILIELNRRLGAAKYQADIIQRDKTNRNVPIKGVNGDWYIYTADGPQQVPAPQGQGQAPAKSGKATPSKIDMTAANKVKADLAAGLVTREQAVEQLRKLGFQ